MLGALEEPHAVAEKDGHEVDLDLVEETRLQVLAGDVGTADNQDVLAGCRRPRLVERGFDALGDEGIGGAPPVWEPWPGGGG